MPKFELKEKKIPLQKSLSTTRTFSYSKDGVSLNFQLQVDDGGKQLKAFKECLETALTDIAEMLER